MSSITRKVLTALVASAVTASAAAAQSPDVTFSTTSRFFTSSPAVAGCNTGSFMLVATCTGGGFTLTFTGNAQTVGTPTNALLGTFNLTGTGSVLVPTDRVFLDILISQTNPTTGTANIIGTFSGEVTSNSSQLIFTPTEGVEVIGPVTYDLTLEANGSRSISINRLTSLEADISVVPEPATVVLMGSGLAALGFFGARRKKA